MQDNQGIELAKKAIEESIEVAKEFVGKLVNPGLEEGGGIIQDTVKFWRFKNQINILVKAKEFLERKGLEPQKVLPKTLVPLLESGSLEEDEVMQNRWIALLANAANPNFVKTVRPSFVEMLKELSPEEAAILDGIFNLVEAVPIPREEWLHRGAVGQTVKDKFDLDDAAFGLAVDNLYRLRLCQPPSTQLNFIDNREQRFQLQMKEIICITDLGYAFVKACRLPKD